MNIYEVLTTYQRDRQGRAQSRRMGAGAQRRGLVVTYTYCPNGLLANETEVQGNGPPRQVRRYATRFTSRAMPGQCGAHTKRKPPH